MPAPWATIQNSGSLTWTTATEPSPAAAAASARPVALSRPSAPSIGSVMPDAVSTALSEWPCSALTVAAATNGASTPRRASSSASAARSAKPASSRTRASPPAAPMANSGNAQPVSARAAVPRSRATTKARPTTKTASMSGRLIPVQNSRAPPRPSGSDGICATACAISSAAGTASTNSARPAKPVPSASAARWHQNQAPASKRTASGTATASQGAVDTAST